MAIRQVIIAPDSRLKLRSSPVERVDDPTRALIDDMLETMYAAPGVGLAAPQIGVLRRVIVVDLGSARMERAPMCMVNPEIVWASDELQAQEEGCLSFPEQFAEVTRPARIRLRYLDRQGEIREREADGMLATCIQHEIDHLDGLVFVDHISGLRRGIILRRLMKARKAGAMA